jgi:hypothetical protein
VMRDYLDAPTREVTVQVNKTEDQLFTHLLDSLPDEAEPPARSIAPGLDVIPFAFDRFTRDTPMLTAFHQVAKSTQAWVFARGDGTFVTRNRHQLMTNEVSFVLDRSMVDLVVPSSLEGVYNHVEIVVHDKSVGADNVTVLTPALASPIPIAPGETQEIFVDYGDAISTSDRVAGTEFQPTQPGIDYAMRSNPDGTGDIMDDDLAITVSPFGTTAKFEFRNDGSRTGYITKRQVRGRALKEFAPTSVVSFEPQRYGQRSMTLDFDLMTDPNKARPMADYIRILRQNFVNRVEEATFLANRSVEHMRAALSVEIGDRIAINEPVTGMVYAEALVRSIALELDGEGALMCRWGLTPTGVMDVFILDHPTYGRMDLIPLGFA